MLPGMSPDAVRVRKYVAQLPRATRVKLRHMQTAIRRAFARGLGQYETSKGTVRFPLNRPLPVGLVKRLVKARIRELPPRPRP